MTPYMLEVKNLSVSYGPLQAVRGACLEVRSGEFVALVGPNGAGKTTLLKTISGLLRPVAGEVFFDGHKITGLPPAAICGLGLIQVPEGRKIFPNLTVGDNLRLGAYLPRARARMKESMEEVFEIFPRLRERIGQRAGTMSGGEQQMLAVGRGLMAQPRLLILDEPTLGLSPLLAKEILNTTKLLNKRGLAVLIVSQEVLQVLQLADRAYIMENGVVRGGGSAQELARDPDIRKVYIGL